MSTGASSDTGSTGKHLKYSDDHFQGYWIQLNSLIRKNEDADDLLDGFLKNPLEDLLKASQTNDDSDGLVTICKAIKTLYVLHGYGHPPGTFPPTAEQLGRDPLNALKDFMLATKRGTTGGRDDSGNQSAIAKKWVKASYKEMLRFRKACKHMWETAVATLNQAQATTIIAGLPYGSGPALLKQIEAQQTRQTTMALFTLFTNLITLRLGTGEGLREMYARMHQIRTRLLNWKPPVVLPDKLMMVCILRLLPARYHGTRTIIMSNPKITLKGCKELLLDVENADAERVLATLGTKGAKPTAAAAPEASGLLVGRPPKKPSTRTRGKKTAKYHSEGPCPVHGSKGNHAASECWELHPELKPDHLKKKKPKASAAVATTEEKPNNGGAQAFDLNDASPFGFMNDDVGYCLMMFSLDDEEKTEDDTDTSEPPMAEATAVDNVPATVVCQERPIRFYAVARGHVVGIFYSDKEARQSYSGYSGAKHKCFKTRSKAEKFLEDHRLESKGEVATGIPVATATLVEDSAVKKTTATKAKTKRRKKNYKWTQKGTKKSRRKAKHKPVNEYEAEHVHLSSKNERCDVNLKNIKRLARTGGIKDLTKEEHQDSTGSNEETIDLTTEHYARRSSAPPPIVFSGLHNTLRVRTKRSFAPNQTTTMYHPQRISKYAIHREDTSTEEESAPQVSSAKKEKPAHQLPPHNTFVMRLVGLGGEDTGNLPSVLTPGTRLVLRVEDIIPSTRGHAMMAVGGDNNGYDGDEEDMSDWATPEGNDEWKWLKTDEDADEDLPELLPISTSTSNDTDTDELPELLTLSGTTSESDSSSSLTSTADEEPPQLDIGGPTDSDDELPPLVSQSSSDSESSSEQEELPILVPGSSSESESNSEWEELPQLVSPSDSESETYSETDDDTFEVPTFQHNESEDDTDSVPALATVYSSSDTESENEAPAVQVYVAGSPTKHNTVLDSGASEHCATKVKGTLKPAPVGSIHGLSGAGATVTGKGTVRSVNNVMCVPTVARNLLSVGRLLDQTEGKMVFTKDQAYLVTNKKSKVLAKRENGGLYYVTNLAYQLADEPTGPNGTAMVGDAVSIEVAKQRIIALHRAYGHASISTMRVILKARKFKGITVEHLKLMPPCDACLLGKAHKAPKKRHSDTKATVFAYRLCADCTGPFRTRSVGGSYYLLVVIDEWSAWTWVVPMPDLKGVHTHLETIIEVQLHQRDDRSVKFFRSDGGREFVNTKVNVLLAKHGIVRETTCPNTSFQNGKAERRIRTVFERVRTVLSDAGKHLSAGFWADAAVYAAYTLNRTPTETSVSPFALRYGRPPKISHLRPFGNPCVVYRDRSVAGKEKDAGVKGYFLGYGYVHGKKGYRVRVAGTNKVLTTLNVAFGAYPVSANEVGSLTSEDEATANARQQQVSNIITTPSNAQEIAARANLPIATETDDAPEPGAPIITEPYIPPPAARHHSYLVGAKVAANWKGRGEYYSATVTGVRKAGARGTRTTYDLRYDADGEKETAVSNDLIRPRTTADVATTKKSEGMCGHALMTDCNPMYLANVPDMASAHITPKGFGRAVNGPDAEAWIRAMNEELKSLEKQGVYVHLEKLPPNAKVLNSVWVYKVKCGPDGKVTRYKARLTVNGKTQRYGIDYTETFSPVAFATTIRLVLALGLACNFVFNQYDIKCAFLYADLPKDQQVFMRAPPGYGKRGYWRLVKSLYGLKQAPMLFNDHLTTTLKELGFTSCTFDPCLFHHQESGAYLVVVVDDMILASPSKEFAKHFHARMSKVYDIKDLGEPKYVIGVRVNIKPDSITLKQDRYIKELAELHTPGAKPTSTPAVPGDILCLTGIAGKPESPLLPDAKVYRSLIGGLMYTLITRPDVATAVSMCSRYLQQPRVAHLAAARRILRYLLLTVDTPLVYPKCLVARIICFVDASWGNDVDTRRSRYGYAIYVGRSLVSWRSKLHTMIALSSAEAEYVAATEAAKTMRWIRSLLEFLGCDVPKPSKVFEDNAACRTMVKSSQVSGRNKHFELKQHYVRQQVAKGLLQFHEIATGGQIADIMTKSLARPCFHKHATALLEGLPAEYCAGTCD